MTDNDSIVAVAERVKANSTIYCTANFADAVLLANAVIEMAHILKRWDYYREALLAKEFDGDSQALRGLLDRTAAAIGKEGE